MNWRQKRDVSGVRYLLEIAEEHAVSITACLAGSAIAADTLSAFNGKIEAWQELAVIRNLLHQINHPGLGIAVGRRYHLTSLGILGFTMLASENLMNALSTLDRFQSLALAICPVKTEIEPRGVWVTFDDRVLPEDTRRFVIERGLSAVISVVSELMQRDVVPLELQVRFDATPDTHTGYSELPAPLQFAAPRNGVLFANDDLHHPLPQANLASRFQGEQLCGRLIQEIQLSPNGSSLVHRVQQVLLENPSSLLTSKDVATCIGLSDRTLHRRLADEGLSFRQLNDQIKQRLAKQMLSASTLDMHSIAQHLGYAEAASFSRAFIRWTGQNPGHWKRTHKTLN